MPYFVFKATDMGYAITCKSTSLGDGVKELDRIWETAEMGYEDLIFVNNYFRMKDPEDGTWLTMGDNMEVGTNGKRWSLRFQKELDILMMNYEA